MSNFVQISTSTLFWAISSCRVLGEGSHFLQFCDRWKHFLGSLSHGANWQLGWRVHRVDIRLYICISIYIYCIIHIDSTVAAVHSGPGTGSLATGLDVKHRPTGACNPTYYCWKPAWNAYPNVLLAILDEIQKYWARKWNIRYTFGGIVISTSCWPMVG